MNTQQFSYIKEVLGISSVIQPKEIQSIYRLSEGFLNQTGPIDFLFFCDPITKPEEKNLLKKMAQALSAQAYLIVEILNPKDFYTKGIETHLLTRFIPKGLVFFGPLITQKPESVLSSFQRTVPLNQNQTYRIPGCVLHPLSDFMSADSFKSQQIKQQAWSKLTQTFTPKAK